jgi:small neutral amino acid transporter SnatA (MarC family)
MTRLPLLHGVGGPYDEAIIFGGIGVLLIALGFLSWKASKDKEKRRKKRKARRKR